MRSKKAIFVHFHQHIPEMTSGSTDTSLSILGLFDLLPDDVFQSEEMELPDVLIFWISVELCRLSFSNHFSPFSSKCWS